MEEEEGGEEKLKLMLLEVIGLFSHRESVTISVNISVTVSKIIFNSCILAGGLNTQRSVFLNNRRHKLNIVLRKQA